MTISSRSPPRRRRCRRTIRTRAAGRRRRANYPRAGRGGAARALEWLLCRNLLRNAWGARRGGGVAARARGDFAKQPLPDGLADGARRAVERVEARDRLDAALA